MAAARAVIVNLCDEVDRLHRHLAEGAQYRDVRPEAPPAVEPVVPPAVEQAPAVPPEATEEAPPVEAHPEEKRVEVPEAAARIISGLVDALRKCRGALASTWPKGSPEDIAASAIRATIGPPDSDLAAELNALADRYCRIEERDALKAAQTSLALIGDPDLTQTSAMLREMMAAVSPARDLLVRWEQGVTKTRRWYDVVLDKIRTPRK